MATVLERYGNFAARNPEVVIGVALIFTVILGTYAVQLEIETDFEKTLPEHLESVKNAQLLRDTFAEPQTFFILVKLTTDKAFSGFTDIRDIVVMSELVTLENRLRENPEIAHVFGTPDLLIQVFGSIPQDQEAVNAVFAEQPEFFSRDYSSTLLFIETNLGNDDEKILGFVDEVKDDIEAVGFPGSITLEVTGGPLVQTTIFSLLLDDLIRTVGIAAIFILLVLIIAYRSPIKGIYSITLLFMALLWTGGTMKMLDIPLSIITVMVGSLIIGIGIDYSIHIINRYTEERKAGIKEHEAAGIAVDKVGMAIIATSVTTIVSFISQAGAGIPFLTHMGIALSLGIFYALVAALLLLPAIVVVEEKIVKRWGGYYD